MKRSERDPFAGRALLAQTWTRAIYEVEGLLTGLLLGPGGYLVFNVAREDDPFVQFLTADDDVSAEAAATVRIRIDPDERVLVDRDTADRLVGLGWRPPEANPMRLAQPDDRPNFYMEPRRTRGWSPPMLAELAVRTLVEVWAVEVRQVRVRRAWLRQGETASRA